MNAPASSTKEIRWADAGPVWRERIFWMAAGMFVLWFFSLIIGDLEKIALCSTPALQNYSVLELATGLPLLLVGFLVAKGRLNRHLDFWFFQSRPRLIALWLILSVLGSCYSFIAYDDNHFHFAGWAAWRQDFFFQWLNFLSISAVPLFLLLWLLPARNRIASASELSAGSPFDLSTALAGWRHELDAQPQLTADDQRELERHLADAVAELRQRGLGEEESFRQARQRIGSPPQLAEEFAKADPSRIWRERIFWAALGILLFWQVGLVMAYVTSTLVKLPVYFIPSLARFYHGGWLMPVSDLILLLMAALIIRGRMRRVSILAWFFQSRIRLAALLVGLAVFCSWGQCIDIRIIQAEGHIPWTDWGKWIDFCLHRSFVYLFLGAGPVILAVWFLPRRYQKMPRKVSRPISD